MDHNRYKGYKEVKDIQNELGISRRFAYDLVNRPDFPSFRVGTKILIPADAFARWIEEGGTKRRVKDNG